jgi:hypothetical protein
LGKFPLAIRILSVTPAAILLVEDFPIFDQWIIGGKILGSFAAQRVFQTYEFQG